MTASPQLRLRSSSSLTTSPRPTPFLRPSLPRPRAQGYHKPRFLANRLPPTASASPTSPPSTRFALAKTVLSQVLSLALLILIQRLVQAQLTALAISFPASLAAMLLLFALISLSRFLGLSPTVDRLNAACFTPGVSFLTRWLAVFFVPNLVMLPLAPSLPAADLAKISAILVLGFFFSLFSSACVCTSLRFLVRKTTGKTPAKVVPQTVAPNPPSNNLIAALTAIVTLTLAFSARMATVACLPAKIYALAATVLTFCLGQRLPPRVKALLHPLITCTAATIGLMALLGSVTGAGFTAALSSYYVRTAASWGGGNVLAFLLGPAVITFAFIMDKQRRLALARIVEVVGTSLAATLASLFGTAAAARALKMTHTSRLIVIPRTITAPLAVAIAELLRANVGLAASVVALTGLLGANIGATTLSAAGVTDPVVRGLAVGASAHGLGTAALSDEGAAFPFSALAMTLVGIFSTVLVAYAPFRALLIRVAVGKVFTGAPVAQ